PAAVAFREPELRRRAAQGVVLRLQLPLASSPRRHDGSALDRPVRSHPGAVAGRQSFWWARLYLAQGGRRSAQGLDPRASRSRGGRIVTGRRIAHPDLVQFIRDVLLAAGPPPSVAEVPPAP